MAIDELHALLRIVKKMYDDLAKIWGIEPALKFLKDIHIDHEAYSKLGRLPGNECKKILKNLDKLRDLVPQNCSNYVNALESFNEIRISCFGQKIIGDYEAKIQAFKNNYSQLMFCDDVSIINKMHLLFDHIAEFVKKKGPLGKFSAQTGEAIHGEFWPYWEKTKVKLPWSMIELDNTTREKIGNALLNSMLEFNADTLKKYGQ